MFDYGDGEEAYCCVRAELATNFRRREKIPGKDISGVFNLIPHTHSSTER